MIATFPVTVFLRIEPLPDGWVLHCAWNDLAQVFRSGAEAERHARRLGRVLLAAGLRPRLIIVDRTGRSSPVSLSA